MPANYKGFQDPSRVVTVEEASDLAARHRGDVVFVDTRNYWRYVKGHIPGAVNLELYAFHWVDTSDSGLRAFEKQMAALLSSCGIDNKKRVIFYENRSGYDAARGVWLLEYLGNKHAALLDGGLNLWKRRGYGLSTDDPRVEPAVFRASPDTSVIATIGALLARRAGRRVVDARSSGEYDGTFKRALKAGHVPSAINIEWKSAVRRDGTLKSAEQLAALYSAAGSKDGEVVTYCQSGYRAAHSWLILRLLGFKRVRNYLGSWYEWGNDSRSKVAKG